MIPDAYVKVTCKHCGIIDSLPADLSDDHSGFKVINSYDWYVCNEGCCIYCIDCAVKLGFDIQLQPQ